ncbi:MAG: ABC transporter ATP-binding protein [Sedimentisphaerales bacterium]|nr:ABC transporter ATP-binding protein [Sedimentisphaerales bacterium]
MKVELTDITKEFTSLRGRVVALDDISIKIDEGEFFVLLGPSGCGKSTLLNLIAGLEKPTAGRIQFDDKVVADTDRRIFLTPKERNVAFVFQSYALYPHLDVFENIAFPLRIARIEKAEIKKAVEQAAATLEITDLLAVRPAELSGGQRQRVAIARAIVRKPNVFLLDEPLSNLDARLRIAMRAEIKNLQDKLGITTVYVTHDQVEAMGLGDRIAVLNRGKIEQIGTPESLYEKPAGIFVAQFIGSPPMNIIDASIIKADGKLCVVLGNQKLVIPSEKIREIEGLKENHFILGLRPEHITINPPDNAQMLTATIHSVESLGRETAVYLDVDGLAITALCDREGMGKGRQVRVRIHLDKMHIFKGER